MASWSQVESHPTFGSLSAEQKRRARETFFQEYVAPQAPSDYYDTLYSEWMQGWRPTAELGSFSVEQEVPEPSILDRLESSPALQQERARQQERLERGQQTTATVIGAGESFIDRTQAAMGGLLSEAGRQAGNIYSNLPFALEPVSEAISGVQQMGEDIALAETTEAQQSRQRAIEQGANELGLDILGALGDLGIQVGATLATRNPGVGAGTAAAQVFGPEYARRLQSGQSREEAAQGALLRSGIEVGTTLPALGVFSRLFGQAGEQATGRIVNTLEQTRPGRGLLGAGAEAAQETTAGILGDAADYSLGFSEESPFSGLAENFREGGIGGVVGGIVGLLSPGRQRTGIPAYDAGVDSVAPELTDSKQPSRPRVRWDQDTQEWMDVSPLTEADTIPPTSLSEEELANAVATLDPERGRRPARTQARVQMEGDVLAQMMQEGSAGNNERFAELMADRGFSTPISGTNVPTEGIVIPPETQEVVQPDTTPPPAEERAEVSEQQTARQNISRIQAQGDVIRQMLEEGYTADTPKRRARFAELMTERGFPTEVLPDAQGRLDRPSQVEPLSVGTLARVQRDGKWTDATVSNIKGDDVSVTFQDGSRSTYPDFEVERMERRVAMPSEAPVSPSEAVSLSETSQVATQPPTTTETRTGRPTALAGAMRRTMQRLQQEGDVNNIRRFKELLTEETGREQPAMALGNYDPARNVDEISTNSIASPAARQAVQASHMLYKSMQTAKEALAAVKERVRGDNQYERLVAALEKNDIGNVKFLVVDPEEISSLPVNLGTDVFLDQKNEPAGVYDSNTDTIYIKGGGWTNNGLSDETILHEIVHAVTYKKIEGVNSGAIKDRETIDAVGELVRFQKLFRSRSKDFEQFDEHTKNILDYTASNPHEFVAVVQTNKRVQDALKKENLWTKFIDLIRRVLGLSRLDKPLLEQLLETGARVIEAQPEFVPITTGSAASPLRGPTQADKAQALRLAISQAKSPEEVSQLEVGALELLEAQREAGIGQAWRAPETESQLSSAQDILTNQPSPRSRSVVSKAAQIAKKLFSQHDVRGKEIDKEFQVQIKGRKNAEAYRAITSANRLVKQAKADGVAEGTLVRALRSGNIDKLPGTVQTIAKEIQGEMKAIALEYAQEKVASLRPNETLSAKDMKEINSLLANPLSISEIFKTDLDPDYAIRLVQNYKSDKKSTQLTPEQKEMVETALNDVMAQVLIPADLARRVQEGEVQRPQLVDYHNKWVGTGVQGKNLQQLTNELIEARDLFIKEAGTEDAVAMYALNALVGASTPATTSPFSKRHDLKNGFVPESVHRLWGDIDNVAFNVQRAWVAMASKLGQYRLMNRLADQWTGKDAPTKGPTEKNTVPLASKEFGRLNGMFVTPVKADVLKSIVAIQDKVASLSDAALQGDMEFNNALLSKADIGVRSLAGTLKAAQIIGTLPNWWFNLIGSPETIAVSGNIPGVNLSKGIQGIKRGVEGILGTTLVGQRAKKANPSTERLYKAGITESAQVGEIRDLLRRLPELRTTLENASTFTKTVTGLAKLVKTGSLSTTELYSIMDLWAPSVTYFKNEDDLRQHWDTIGKEYTEDDLIKEAAHITKNSTVTMAYIPQMIRMLESRGLSYVFPYMYAAHRAFFYNGFLGLAQMQEGFKTGDMTFAYKGLTRTVATGAMFSLWQAKMSPIYAMASIPFIASSNLFSYLSDSDDEEEKAVLEAARQNDMFKHGELTVLAKEEDGTYWVVDMNRALVMEPAQITMDVAMDAASKAFSGEMSPQEAAGEIGKQIGENIFLNAPLVRLLRGIVAPEKVSILRREAPEYYDATYGDNPLGKRVQTLFEAFAPGTARSLQIDYAKSQSGKITPEEARALAAMGFPVYRINPISDAAGENPFSGTRRYANEYRDARNNFKTDAGILAPIDDNKLEALYLEFAREQLESYNKVAPVIAAAYAMGTDAGELEDRMKASAVGVPKATRNGMLDGEFILNDISNEFFKSEIAKAERESRKYSNPEEKFEEWLQMYEERIDKLRDIRDKVQQMIEAGEFK